MIRKVLKICCSEWKNASRDKRELSVYRELGADVLVMAKGKPKDCYQEDSVDGFDVFRFSTRPLGPRIPNIINRTISVFTWAHYAQKFNADVISGHDLAGLLIGHLSNIGLRKNRRAKMIYDSHEFELGRVAGRSKAKLWLIKQLEKFLMKRCAFSIMVNENIADEVQRIHRLKQQPIVVRSTPNYWELNAEVIAITRLEMCRAMGVPEDTFLVMHHGGVIPQKNIEVFVDAVSRNPHIAGIVLGNVSSESYLKQLKKRAEDLGVSGRILFHPAVSIEELYRYIGAVDVGMILHKNFAKNAEYSLPNKFFENIQSLTPLISTNTLVLREYIRQYGIGLTVDVTKTVEIDVAIERMRTDKKLYQKFKTNLKIAKEELCWEKEKEILKHAMIKRFTE